jgi:Family of unknown function (DUF5850)
MVTHNLKILSLVVIATVVVVVAIIASRKKKVKEGYLPSFGRVALPVAVQTNGVNKGQYFSAPTFQALPPPRFNNVDLGAQIRYNLPPIEYRAAPSDPLALGTIVAPSNTEQAYKVMKEGFTQCSNCDNGCSQCGGCESADYHAQPSSPPGYEPGNYDEVAKKVYEGSGSAITTSMMPVSNMTAPSPDGDAINVITFNNISYAIKKDRNYGNGDYFRGDIAVADLDGRQSASMFKVAARPSTMLNPGAMAVLGGVGNNTSQQTATLINQASGGTMTALGGVDYSDPMMFNQMNPQLSAGFTDISVTSFP